MHVKACDVTGTTVDFTNIVHSGCSKFIKEHGIVSRTRENGAVKRCGNTRCVRLLPVYSTLFSMSGKSIV